MQRAQRTFGRLPFLKRTPNEADVEAMLNDFNDSEQMLEKVRYPNSHHVTTQLWEAAENWWGLEHNNIHHIPWIRRNVQDVQLFYSTAIFAHSLDHSD